MTNLVSLLSRLPAAAPFADDSTVQMERLKAELGLLHRELQGVLSHLSMADAVIGALSPESNASGCESQPPGCDRQAGSPA